MKAVKGKKKSMQGKKKNVQRVSTANKCFINKWHNKIIVQAKTTLTTPSPSNYHTTPHPK